MQGLGIASTIAPPESRPRPEQPQRAPAVGYLTLSRLWLRPRLPRPVLIRAAGHAAKSMRHLGASGLGSTRRREREERPDRTTGPYAAGSHASTPCPAPGSHLPPPTGPQGRFFTRSAMLAEHRRPRLPATPPPSRPIGGNGARGRGLGSQRLPESVDWAGLGVEAPRGGGRGSSPAWVSEFPAYRSCPGILGQLESCSPALHRETLKPQLGFVHGDSVAQSWK